MLMRINEMETCDGIKILFSFSVFLDIDEETIRFVHIKFSESEERILSSEFKHY